MFWGLIMEPQKRYTQVIKKAFHISMASLDISNTDGQPSQVMCGFEDRNYLLCTLQKSGNVQCPLDLHFEEGTTVSFATNGKSHVHLTGYLTKDPEEMEESDEDTQEFEVKAQKKTLVKDSKNEDEPQKKKIKQEVVEEEEDSDDSDIDMEKLLNEQSDGEEQSEEESGEEEDVNLEEEEDECSSADSEDENEEDDDDEEEEDEDEEEEEKKVAAMMNGLGKKSKKGKEAPKETPQRDKQTKGKQSMNLTPGPNAKKQENTSLLNEPGKKGKDEKKPKENQTPNAKKPKGNQTPNAKKTLSGGVIVEDLKEGQGDAALNGKFVHVYYEGRLKSGKVFDKAQKGPGFGFRLGKGEVIKGWDIGVSGMKVGGKRRITCPPNLAYGAKGSPPVIPPNSTLVFEVELKKVK